MKEPSGERLDLRRVRVLVRQRLRQGRRRARAAFWPVVTAAVAAGLAWAVAFYALGHTEPFFAPVASWVCLGFNADRQVRKVAELAIGVTLGVGFGELVASLIGTGVPQIMLVIVVAALMARFVDRGHTLTIQAGVQGVVIVALPVVATDGATGRWTDALVGGAFALLVAVLTPGDARRRARQLASASFSDLAQMLDTLAVGIGDGDVERMRDGLAQGRGTQGTLDDWVEVVRNARQAARLSPAARRYVPELARQERASTFADRAMRNARVIARRGMVAVEQGARDDQVADAFAGDGEIFASGMGTIPMLGARLARDEAREIKAVCVVHNDTATGITSDIPAARRAIDDAGHPALLMVDTISSLASIDYRHDEWGVDVTVAGSQKGLMLPPGLSFNAVSDKALKASKTSKLPKLFWSWEEMIPHNERGFFPYTPGTNLLYGLDAAIDMLNEEGLDNVFARHDRHAEATRRAVRAWGLEILCRVPEHYSSSLTAVRVPDGHDADRFRAMTLEAFDISLGTGLTKLTGKVFRIGHLGDTNDLTILGALAGVEMGLGLAGIPHKAGGVQAAMDFFAGEAQKISRLAAE